MGPQAGTQKEESCVQPPTEKAGGSEGLSRLLEIPLRGVMHPKSRLLFPGFENDDPLLSPTARIFPFLNEKTPW